MPVRLAYPGVYVEEIASGITAIPGVTTSTTAFIGGTVHGPSDAAVHCHSFSDYSNAFGTAQSGAELTRSVREFFANGGKSCYVASGLDALDEIPTLNLLVLPRDDGIDESLQRKLAAAASRYCQERRALLLLDAPRDFTRSNARTATAQLHASVVPENVAVFYPDVFFPADGSLGSGTAGAIAGLMARMDKTRGVWKAVAGTEAVLAGDPKPTVELNAADAQVVVDAGVNPIRSLKGHTAVWGARTLAARDGGSEWKYIPVRRLLLYLEESIDQGLKLAVFEPNSDPLWSRLRLLVESFLYRLWRAGAFAGSKPDEAYLVKCGRDTMTQDDIDTGRMILQIGVAPLRPAEFIIFRIQLHQTGPIMVVAREASVRSAAAGAVAGRLRRPLQRVDLSDVVSKYIGETEKNLDRVFADAERADGVLFFDDVDALFGKRTNVPDAHDRYANIEIAYLTERIEAFNGLVILGSNRSHVR